MSTPAPITVAAVQMGPLRGEISRNRTQMIRLLHDAAAFGARLVVFPECALTGYCFESRDNALAVAEPVDGPSLRLLADDCAWQKVFAVFGFLERDGDRLYNSCALVGPEGVVGTYRKIHLPRLGVDRFVDPGDRPFAVHEVQGVRVGMLICYDASFPESCRVLTLLGADVLALPTNWPTHAEWAAEHLVVCRAAENAVYVAAANRVGEEGEFHFLGRSSIAGPQGDRLAAAGPTTEEILYAEVDPVLARRKHLVRVPGKHEIDRLADRRPEFYGELVKPRASE